MNNNNKFPQFFVDKSKNFFTPRMQVHFVGIGGIGMCGLAELLHLSGSIVTGSDLVENTQVKRLKKLGIKIFIGHKEKNIGIAEIIIQSSAVPKNNIEIQTAKNKKILVIKRSEALAEIMRLKRGLVISGTHGKTTTTHLLASIFIHNKKDPTVFIGGRSNLFQSTAFLGKGEWFISESDESDGGFKYLYPEVAVITNIDKDHLDYYGSFKKLQTAFLNFVLKVPFYGCVIAWGDQKEIRNLLSGIDQKVIFYGFNKNNHFVLKKQKDLQYKFFVNQKLLGNFKMPLAGDMNALNMLAACAAAMTIGISFKECVQSFHNFKGVDRRFQKKAQVKQIDFYDDYAHHPTEIKSTLLAFREKFGKDRRLIVLFQPHRFSRTATTWSNLLNCFKEADQVFLMDIYPAGERPLKGISSKKLKEQMHHPNCFYCPEKKLFPLLLQSLQKRDVFITMGAGCVYQYGEQLIDLFKQKKHDKKNAK